MPEPQIPEQADGDAILVVDKVWKKYSKSLDASLKHGLRDTIGEAIDRRQGGVLREEEFWALRDVSFTVRKGDAIGLMGRNGAGKSTLLKIISGLLKPDKGEVTVRGDVQQMIEMAGGFKRDLTGLENIAFRAKLLGIPKKEIPAIVEDVEEFTELGDFLKSPVGFYSSGMKARLGFALATLRTPDLLIVDEALTVGDLPFRLKCYERISNMLSESALLMVSHSTGNVKRFCNLGGYLKKGQMAYFGDLQSAIEAYQDEYVATKNPTVAWNPELIPVKWLAGGEEIEEGGHVPADAPVSAVIDTRELPGDCTLLIRLRIPDGTQLCEWNSDRAGIDIKAASHVRIDMGPLNLAPNYYAMNASAMAADGHTLLAMSPWRQLKMTGHYNNDVPLQLTGKWSGAEA